MICGRCGIREGERRAHDAAPLCDECRAELSAVTPKTECDELCEELLTLIGRRAMYAKIMADPMLTSGPSDPIYEALELERHSLDGPVHAAHRKLHTWATGELDAIS